MHSDDATSATCHVYTFKEGLLSAVAHDLKLRVDRWTIEHDDERVVATFDAASLRVECAMSRGVEAGDALSAKDKAETEENIRKDVLDTRRHREITFTSSRVTKRGDGYVVAGVLRIKGRERAITVPVEREGATLVAHYALEQPDFGIKPFSAMLGTLKIKPEVQVVVKVPVR